MKENVLNFSVFIYQDEDGVFVAEAPALPGCHTQGDSYERAIGNIEEAIRLCLKVAQTDDDYRDRLDLAGVSPPKFVGISEITLPRPAFL